MANRLSGVEGRLSRCQDTIVDTVVKVRLYEQKKLDIRAREKNAVDEDVKNDLRQKLVQTNDQLKDFKTTLSKLQHDQSSIEFELLELKTTADRMKKNEQEEADYVRKKKEEQAARRAAAVAAALTTHPST